MGKDIEVARKNAAICKRETSTFLSLSSYTCLEENQWKDYLIPILGQRRATRRYMRRSGSLTLQTGVKEWLDGGKKRHAQALVWCTWVTQIRYGWAGSQLSSQMLLILVATLLHIQDQCFRYVVVVYI